MPGRRRVDWIQFGILLATLLAIALHEEGRLARVEQQLADGEADRKEFLRRLSVIEEKWDRFQATHSQSPTTP
jgi:hypothetical protein